MRLAFATLALSIARAEIVVSRHVNQFAGSGTVTVGSAGETLPCSSSDEFGSNDCKLHWGSAYNIGVNLTLTEPIEAGMQINVNAKLDGLVPLKFSCPVSPRLYVILVSPRLAAF
jgi:opacity protein-like surface antigen